jgi:adenylate kinase family enzyme
VVGLSGAGKTTLARSLAAALGVPHIELDAINWQAGWRDLNTHDPAEFVRRVEAAIAAPAWVSDGNYGRVAPRIRAHATDVVWLDYSRVRIMSRVLRRSLIRSLSGREVWPGTGNVEYWRNWLSLDHPALFAWTAYNSRRRRYEAAFAAPEAAHLTVHRLRSPREADALLARLTRGGA